MKIDVDALFDNYLDDFIEKNLDKYSPNQLEKMVESLYEEFGNKANLVLCGLSPIEYYKQMTTEDLLTEFKESFEEIGSACEFLCRELQKRQDAEDNLVDFAKSKNTEIATCAVNVLSEMNSKKALLTFLKSVESRLVEDELYEVMVEAMSKNADCIKEELLSLYDSNNYAHKVFLEIFASMSKDERVYQILFDEYLRRTENRTELYGFFAKYGDERILGFLYGEVETKQLTPIELEEIKLAIEKLGGDFNNLINKNSH